MDSAAPGPQPGALQRIKQTRTQHLAPHVSISTSHKQMDVSGEFIFWVISLRSSGLDRSGDSLLEKTQQTGPSQTDCFLSLYHKRQLHTVYHVFIIHSTVKADRWLFSSTSKHACLTRPCQENLYLSRWKGHAHLLRWLIQRVLSERRKRVCGWETIGS